MKTKTYILILFLFTFFQLCKAQQTETTLSKVENHLKGDLDYTHEALELIQWQKNGDEITLGKIDKNGVIHFNLLEYDIKSLQKNARNINFQSQFQMLNCKDKGEVGLFGESLAKTPFDDVYYQLYAPIFVKKYGEVVAYLYPISDEKKLIKKNYNKIIGSNYYWFYIDRTIDYKDECVQTSTNGADLEINISADIQFKKGWNFIRRNIVAIQNYGENNDRSMPKNIKFTLSSPDSKEVKWFLEQRMDDEKIQAAKKIYNSTSPITKEQIEKWVPRKAGDFTRTSYKIGKKADGITTKNNVFLVFENGNQKMEITVVDGAQSPNDLKTASLDFARGEEKIDNEVHYASIYNEREKSFKIMSLFNERIILDVVGYNITEQQLWEAIKALDIASISK